MTSALSRRLCAAALLAAAAGAAHAIGVTDAKGDYVAGYAGSRAGDLDVVGGFVSYNIGTGQFVFSGTMDADIGTTAGGFYVWGVNRGGNTAGFAANGLPNILFDTVVILRSDGTGSVNRLSGTGQGASTLAAGAVQKFGTTIIAAIDGSLLPSNGLAPTAYTWNVWPRDAALPAGFGQISDFAPDASNIAVTLVGAVPEPASTALLAAGLGLLAWRVRRSARRDRL